LKKYFLLIAVASVVVAMVALFIVVHYFDDLGLLYLFSGASVLVVVVNVIDSRMYKRAERAERSEQHPLPM